VRRRAISTETRPKMVQRCSSQSRSPTHPSAVSPDLERPLLLLKQLQEGSRVSQGPLFLPRLLLEQIVRLMVLNFFSEKSCLMVKKSRGRRELGFCCQLCCGHWSNTELAGAPQQQGCLLIASRSTSHNDSNLTKTSDDTFGFLRKMELHLPDAPRKRCSGYRTAQRRLL